MSTEFPTALDEFLSVADNPAMNATGRTATQVVGQIQAALAAVQAVIGVTGSSVAGTVEKRLADQTGVIAALVAALGAPVVVSDTSPEDPAEGAIWLDTSAAPVLKVWVDGSPGAWVAAGGGGSSAEAVSYDNTASGLAATDVQEAIDGLAQSVSSVAGFDDLVASLYFKRPTSTYPPIFETPYRVFGAFGASTCHSGAGRNSGKLYFECFVNTVSTSGNMGIGIVQFNANTNTEMGASTNTGNFEGQWAQLKSGFVLHGTGTAYGPSYTSGDVVMVAVDFDLPSGSRKIWWGKNGLWTGDPVAGTGHAYSNLANFCMPGVSPATGGRLTLRLKASEFSYSPPSGFSPWVA